MMGKWLAAAVAAMTMCGVRASSYSVEPSTSGTVTTFKIVRTGDVSSAETVRCRTVSRTALEGTHFRGVNETVSFLPGQTNRIVQVRETPIDQIAYHIYRYQTGLSRSYGLEVLDEGGFTVASADREIAFGSSYKLSTDHVVASESNIDLVYFKNSGYASGISSAKYVDVQYTPPSDNVDGSSGLIPGYVSIDDSYDYRYKPVVVWTSNLIARVGATAQYHQEAGNKLYATVCFTEKERNDGYAYIQILADDSSGCDGADPNAVVNDPSRSLYKACFELYKGPPAYGGEGKQFFPHRYDYNNRSAGAQSAAKTEFYLPESYLWQHKFQSGFRASNSGSLVLDPTTRFITTRFDCGGEDNDTFGFKDLFVRMAMVDGAAPTLKGVYISSGPYCRGNDVSVSFAFSEALNVTFNSIGGYVSTSWGTFRNTEFTGGNVVTFAGSISSVAVNGTAFVVNGFSGVTLKDLLGNTFNNAGVKNLSVNAVVESTSHDYTVSYDLAGGELPAGASNPTTYNYDTLRIPLVNPTRFAYVFKGWSGTGISGTATNVVLGQTFGDRFFTANWEPVDWAAEGRSGDTEKEAYLIYTTDQLDLLASRVMDGASYSGKHFRLMADLAYDPAVQNNFSPIGGCDQTGNRFAFSGSFDGGGHTVSGVRISSAGTGCAGLFGLVDGGSIRNLTLADAYVDGGACAGGIVAIPDNACVDGCFVCDSTVCASEDEAGAVACGSSTSLWNNAYHNCVVGGSSGNVGTGEGDVRGQAEICYDITLADGVVVASEPDFRFPVHGATNSYWRAGTEVRLEYLGELSSGEVAQFVVNGAAPLLSNVFEMPQSNTTVTAAVTGGHVWSVPQYAWAADRSCVTATVHCTHCSMSHTSVFPATSSSVVNEATCTAAGTTRWTAEVPDNVFGFTRQTADVSGVPAALGHDFSCKCSWSDDCRTATFVLSCKREGCGERVELPGEISLVGKTWDFFTWRAEARWEGKRYVSTNHFQPRDGYYLRAGDCDGVKVSFLRDGGGSLEDIEDEFSDFVLAPEGEPIYIAPANCNELIVVSASVVGDSGVTVPIEWDSKLDCAFFTMPADSVTVSVVLRPRRRVGLLVDDRVVTNSVVQVDGGGLWDGTTDCVAPGWTVETAVALVPGWTCTGISVINEFSGTTSRYSATQIGDGVFSSSFTMPDSDVTVKYGIVPDRALHIGTNTVQAAAQYPDRCFSFTPESSGWYMLSRLSADSDHWIALSDDSGSMDVQCYLTDNSHKWLFRLEGGKTYTVEVGADYMPSGANASDQLIVVTAFRLQGEVRCLELGENHVSLTNYALYWFVPAESGWYRFRSEGGCDPTVVLNVKEAEIAYHHDDVSSESGNKNFDCTVWMEEGWPYDIHLSCTNDADSVEFNVIVSKSLAHAVVAESAAPYGRIAAFGASRDNNYHPLSEAVEGTTVWVRTDPMSSAHVMATLNVTDATGARVDAERQDSCSNDSFDYWSFTMPGTNVTISAAFGPKFPKYLDDAYEDVIDNYVNWADTYGYDIFGENEEAFLLDVAPTSIVAGAKLLKIVDYCKTNVLYDAGVPVPSVRLYLESEVAELKPSSDFSDFAQYTLCNGYANIRITPDLSIPRDRWGGLTLPVFFEDGRTYVVAPDITSYVPTAFFTVEISKIPMEDLEILFGYIMLEEEW